MVKIARFFLYFLAFIILWRYFYEILAYLEIKYDLLVFARPRWGGETIFTPYWNNRFAILFSVIGIVLWKYTLSHFKLVQNVLFSSFLFIILTVIFYFFIIKYYPYINMRGFDECNWKASSSSGDPVKETSNLYMKDFIAIYGEPASASRPDILDTEEIRYIYPSRSDYTSCRVVVDKDGKIEYYQLAVML